MKAFIGDGYDQTFYIKGEPGLYPDCRFNGRIMAHHQTAAVLFEDEQAEGIEKLAIQHRAVASRLTGWSCKDEAGAWQPITDHDGGKLAINAKNVGGLPFGLFNRIRDVIFGLRPADDDPERNKPARDVEADVKN